MQPIDCYLRSVRFWLPADQKDDILAELREDIRSEVDEQQAELGRELTDPELEALLKRRGDPMQVAEQYLPKRYLIGPLLFPIYWMFLRSLVLYFLFPWAILWLCFTAAVPSYYADRPWFTLLRTLAPMWTFGVYTVIGLTIGFAIAERVRATYQDTSPQKLPTRRAAKDPNRVPRSTSIAEVVWNGFILLWWANALRMPTTPDLQMATSASIVQYFYWPVLLLLMATVIVAAANFIWPVWTKARAAARLAVDVAGLAIVSGMIVMWARGGVFVDLSSTKFSATQMAGVQQWIGISCVITLLLIGVSYAVRAFQDSRRALGKQPSLNRAVKLLVGE